MAGDSYSVAAQNDRVEWPWNRAEYARALREMQRSRELTARDFFRRRSFVLSFGVFFFVAVYLTASPPLVIMGVAGVVVVLAALIAEGVDRAVGPWWRTRKAAKLCEGTTSVVQFSGEALRYEWSHTALEIKPNGVKRVVEGPEFYFFFVEHEKAIFLPKRVLTQASFRAAVEDFAVRAGAGHRG